jgi:LysM repeat protein
MNKFPVRFIFTISLIMFVMILFFNTSKVNSSTSIPQYKTVLVEKGDTLWSITKNNCTNYKDIRKAIYYIKRANNITSANVNPGQIIKIPYEFYK